MAIEKKNKPNLQEMLKRSLPGGMTSLINEVDKPREEVNNVENNTPHDVELNGGENIEILLRHYKEKKGTLSKNVYIDDEVKTYLAVIRSTDFYSQFTTGQIVSAILTDFYLRNKDLIIEELTNKVKGL